MTFGDQPADFDLRSGDALVRVRFEFPSDGQATRAEYVAEPGVILTNLPPTFRLRFFNLGANAFTDGPIRLGTLRDNGLWLIYEVTPAIGSRSVKKITYTFWEGPASDPSGKPF